MVRVLITGAAGFIGAHLTEHLLKNTDWDIVVLDRLNYASSGLDRLRDVKAFCEHRDRVRVFTADLVAPMPVGLEKEIGSVDYILHLAAETHVDNSIARPGPFVMSNVVGTYELLQFARRQNFSLRRFVQFSTDEVFGPAAVDVNYGEEARMNPTNPYSATKAAAEMLCLAWSNTYGLPMLITRAMNNFGERQHPEKFIPLIVQKLLSGETITVHADSTKSKSGSRFYIHARNTASAILFLLRKEGQLTRCEKVNIVGEREVSNLDLVRLVHRILCRLMSQRLELKVDMVDFHSSRPGHDLRYALDGSKLRGLGWEPPKTFEESLEQTVQWMVAPENIRWLLMAKEVCA